MDPNIEKRTHPPSQLTTHQTTERRREVSFQIPLNLIVKVGSYVWSSSVDIQI